MSKLRVMSLGMAVFLFASVPALAQEEAEDPVTLEEVVVEAQREVSAERNSQRVDVEASKAPVVSTVPDVLDQTEGVDTQSRGILIPKNSQVRLRGLDERRSLILLDGRPLNGTGVYGGYFVDWSALPLRKFEVVDVGLGAFSAKYGNTLGGTVDLIPKWPTEDLELDFTTGYKRYDTFGSGGYGSMKWGPLGALVTAGYDATDGHLRNSEVERSDFSGDFYYFLGSDGAIKGSILYSEGDFNMPVENFQGLAEFDDGFPESSGSRLIGPGVQFPSGDRHGDNSFYEKRRLQLDLSLQKELMGVDTEAKLYYNNEERDDQITSVLLDEVVLEREAIPDRSWGWLFNLARTFGAHRLGLGAEGNYLGYGAIENTFVKPDFFKRPPLDSTDEWDATRRHGIYVDDSWAALRNLDLYFGLRYEDYLGDRTADIVQGYNAKGKPQGFKEGNVKFDDEALLPKLGAVYRPADWLALHGRFARATRMPDNPAFFWYYGGYRPEVDPRFDIVRDDLSMEDALQYEAGVTLTGLKGIDLGFSYYHYRVDDYIRWIFGYAPSRVVYNIDRVTLQGFELDAEGEIWDNIYGFANFTYQKTEKEGDVLDASNALSDELSELPPVKANWGVKYQRDDGTLARLTFRYVGPREVPLLTSGEKDPGGGSNAPDGAPIGVPVRLEELDGFVTLDFFTRYPIWKKGFEGYLKFGIENLADKVYREEYDFQAPRRSFNIGLDIKF